MSILAEYLPRTRSLNPISTAYPGTEDDVISEVQSATDPFQIAIDLTLGGEPFAPAPILPEFRLAVFVQWHLCIVASTRVVCIEPGAAKIGTGLDQLDAEALLSELVQRP